jgi:hypothetical protein
MAGILTKYYFTLDLEEYQKIIEFEFFVLDNIFELSVDTKLGYLNILKLNYLPDIKLENALNYYNRVLSLKAFQ